jgi:hypothetical protein
MTKLEIPIGVPKINVFGDNLLPHGLICIDETLKGTSLAETASIDAFAEENTGKNFASRQPDPYGEPRPPSQALKTLAYLVVPPT